jgi:hypothetical protein
MLAQAKLFAEIARRTQAPVDALPPGDPGQALVLLWQEAAAWAIAAGTGRGPPPSLTAALRGAPADLVARAAGGREWVPHIERALELDPRRELGPQSSAASAATQAALLSQFVRNLIAELEAPTRARQRWLLAHWGKRAGLALVLFLLVGTAARLWLQPRDRVPGALMTTSSQWRSCSDGSCGDALFHTQEEKDPWVMFDLGAPGNLHRVEVSNRSDCCYARAVPLVVETSDDGKVWTARARAERVFTTWSHELSGRARFVRLRVDGTAYLHLAKIVIR